MQETFRYLQVRCQVSSIVNLQNMLSNKHNSILYILVKNLDWSITKNNSPLSITNSPKRSEISIFFTLLFTNTSWPSSAGLNNHLMPSLNPAPVRPTLPCTCHSSFSYECKSSALAISTTEAAFYILLVGNDEILDGILFSSLLSRTSFLNTSWASVNRSLSVLSTTKM